MYKSEATSVQGFVQQVAVQYVTHGYWFYVPGQIPKGKDPAAIDRKLIKRYAIDVSRSERSRRKRAGRANVQYIRFQRTFVLMATHGVGRFFEEEANVLLDVRRTPFKAFGYSVGYRGGHASVRIEREEYKRLKALFLDLACRRSVESLAEELRRITFEPYAPIRAQLIGLLRIVNRARKASGYEPVPFDALRLRRRIYRPFEGVAWGQASPEGSAPRPQAEISRQDGE